MESKTEVLIEDVQANRAAWLEARSTRLGASEMASICGLNKWRTPLDVWLEKTGKRPPEPENDAMWLGTELEPVVGKMFERKLGRKPVAFKNALTHKSYPWAMATPDFIINEPGQKPVLLETKTTTMESAWEGDKTPDAAHIQNIFQLGIGGFEQGEIACLILSTRSFVHRIIPFSQQVFSQLIEKGEEFMDFVKRDIPPAVSTKDDFKSLIEVGLMAIKENTELDIDIEKNIDIAALAAQWSLISTKLKLLNITANEAKKKMESIEIDLRRAMGDYGKARIGQYLLTQKERGRKGFYQNPSKWVEFKISAE